MKQVLIIMLSLMSMLGFSQSRDLGSQCFVSGEGSINIAVDAKAIFKYPDNQFLPILVYINADKGKKVSVKESSILLEVDGKDYPLVAYKRYCSDYSEGERAKDTLSFMFKNNSCMTAKEFISVNSDKWALYQLFPNPKRKEAKVDAIGATYRIGGFSKVYFENPGLKKGDVLTIKVESKSGEKGQVTFEI